MKLTLSKEIMKISVIVRLALSGALCYGAYTETGIFTAISIALILVSIEMTALVLKTHGEALRGR